MYGYHLLDIHVRKSWRLTFSHRNRVRLTDFQFGSTGCQFVSTGIEFRQCIQFATEYFKCRPLLISCNIPSGSCYHANFTSNLKHPWLSWLNDSFKIYLWWFLSYPLGIIFLITRIIPGLPQPCITFHFGTVEGTLMTKSFNLIRFSC